ncbi:MAG: hypothetical protein G01um10142_230 [Parcubacteria group bacterium Gr01-1014_2]|nr:MAG: hypothetical protein G01um10142_230 [Parcubacteria group bacterium Gr01-1014_2]
MGRPSFQTLYFAFNGLQLLMMEFFDFQLLSQTFEDFKLIFPFLAPFKFFILPFLAFFVFLIAKDALLFYSQSKFKSGIEWDMFEIKIPREIEKGPKAMEQFFASLWTLFNTPTGWKEKYIDGEVTRWYSFEIVGVGSRVHFYVWMPKKFRHLIESMLYAQYPDIEIVGTDDYTSNLSSSFDEFERIGYDLFGVELNLKNPAPNPINTYMAFEEKGGEERIIDPISVILETLSRLRPEEKAWIQLVVRPVAPAWRDEGVKVINEIKEKSAPKPKIGPAGTPVYRFSIMTPDEEEKLKSISRKISKQGFETIIRTIYIAPKDIFDKDLLKSLTGYFNQYSSNLNYFAFNMNTFTKSKWWTWPFILSGKRTEVKKRRLLQRYRQRYIPEETFAGRLSDSSRVNLNKKSSISILNTEELATLFHPPTNVVLTAPTLDRIESKKVSPPSYVPYE